jgi:DASS family divalent anion:Na+ symporter
VLALWFYGLPAGLQPNAWHLLIIFACTIAAMVAKVLPIGSVAFIAIAAATATNTITIETALMGFSSKIVWLVVSAFILARGFSKTGLGSRIAYYFVYLFGQNTIGLGYSLVATEFILAPLVPSNTARGAGIMFPIAHALSKESHNHAFGAFVMKLCFHANLITSTIFMTGAAANPLIYSLSKSLGYDLNWLTWAKNCIVPGLVCLLILPLVLFLFFPQALRKTTEIREFAKQQLKNSGPLKNDEWIMLITFLLLLSMWVFSSIINIEPTASAFVGLTILLVTKVLTWEDIVGEKEAWSTFIWLATLLMLSNSLAQLGMISWFSTKVHAYIINYSWQSGFLILAIIYFMAHYLLASATAHVSAMFAPFCSISTMLGAPLAPVVLIFAAFSNLSSCTTHYGSGAAPLYFGAKYVSMQRWWKIGAVIGIINMVIWLILGPIWWRYLNVF